MTVYVDPAVTAPTLHALAPDWPLLTCDGPVDELHAFALSIGVGRGWFSAHPDPSYALTPPARERAVAAGARPALRLLPRQRTARTPGRSRPA